jgi:multiple antibiotic resistance protein
VSGVFPFRFFWEVFITLLVITDPPGIIPVFLGMTSGRPAAERHRLAWQAAVVAFGVIVAFALFGRSVLAYLGVEIPALQIAGGLLLLLVALELLTGKAADPAELEQAKANVAFVPLGTPLLAGPGAIVATMLFVQRIDSAGDAVAFSVALVLVVIALWLAMRFSGAIHRVLRDSGVELLTRIAGLLLSAIAVQLIIGAVRTIVAQG